ncbi:MAG: ABC transporter ATP-binding protein [Candidatus Kariarchaeaceae archaeon]|jgi:putative ABC transport system ATP-binding protein
MSKQFTKSIQTEKETSLVVENLHHKYNPDQPNEVYVLKGIDLTVHEGEIVAIMGPSGCGKTTLLNIIGGLDFGLQGQVIVGSKDISQMKNGELTAFRRDYIGYIFQLFNLFKNQNAVQNVSLPLLLQYEDLASIEMRAELMLQEVGLGDRLYQKPGSLSGGEQQRVAIARILVKSPKLILADEPTGNLDATTSQDIMLLFQRLIQENPQISIIAVTHSELVASYCHRIIRIQDGVIKSEEVVQ